jgi:dipeptidyl aminopeptidase/acylaminoacyl peptidase
MTTLCCSRPVPGAAARNPVTYATLRRAFLATAALLGVFGATPAGPAAAQTPARPAGALVMPAAAVARADSAPRGMVPADYHRFTFVSDPQISPDGRQVAFVVRTVSEDRRSRQGGVWLAPVEGGAPARRVSTGDSDGSPRWSPDGSRLAFLGRRSDGRTQLHLLRMDGGEAEAVTGLRQGSIGSFAWHPDGTRLLLSLDLDPGVGDPAAEPAAAAVPQPDMVVIRNAVYKADGRGFLDATRRQLWVLTLQEATPMTPGAGTQESAAARGVLTRLTPGDSLWNDRGAVLSPDGRLVAFDRDPSGDEYDGGDNRDVFIVPFGGGEPVRLAGQAEGRAEAPVWSPDGRSLLYRYTPEPYARTHLHLIPAAGGQPRVITERVDLGLSDLTWHPSGRFLFATADRAGARPLMRLELDGSGARVLLGDSGSVSGLTMSADGRRLAFLYEHEAALPEVWVADADGRNARALTAFNRDVLASLRLGRLEPFSFPNASLGETHGFLLRPIGWEAGRRYPLVLNIKGGPGGQWGRQWFHEFQMMAAAGYAVAFVNYRGSTGYGHAHAAALRLDYGGADLEDNLHAVDVVLAANGWIDPRRLFVTGGSHGGFLTNLITTRTDRFRAAVTQRSVSNWVSEAGTQAYPPRAMRIEFGGTIWDNFDDYWQRSPLAHAPNVRTPTLVIHSDSDQITPVGQGQEWFFALKALGVPTEMVIFQGEGHGLSRGGKPVNLVERLGRILEWFGRWDAPPAGAAAGSSRE